MFGTILGELLVIFFVLSIPALAAGTNAFYYYARNVSSALFLVTILTVFQSNLAMTYFLSGAIVCGAISAYKVREGLKMVLLEPAMAVVIVLAVIFLKEDAGGLFQGRGFGPTFIHAEGLLFKLGIPLRTEDFGLFTTGGLVGVLVMYVLRPRISVPIAYIWRQRTYRKRRSSPGLSGPMGYLIAPWRLLKRERHRLVARIRRVTPR